MHAFIRRNGLSPNLTTEIAHILEEKMKREQQELIAKMEKTEDETNFLYGVSREQIELMIKNTEFDVKLTFRVQQALRQRQFLLQNNLTCVTRGGTAPKLFMQEFSEYGQELDSIDQLVTAIYNTSKLADQLFEEVYQLAEHIKQSCDKLEPNCEQQLCEDFKKFESLNSALKLQQMTICEERFKLREKQWKLLSLCQNLFKRLMDCSVFSEERVQETTENDNEPSSSGT